MTDPIMVDSLPAPYFTTASRGPNEVKLYFKDEGIAPIQEYVSGNEVHTLKVGTEYVYSGKFTNLRTNKTPNKLVVNSVVFHGELLET